MFNLSNVTVRSLVFVFCVSLGLSVSSLQGVSTLEIAQTALIASALFLGFLIGEAAMGKLQKRALARRRNETRKRD
ncbi:MAG TPA: hypothetical protein VKZ85_04240 [Woeseiaceae bacterium]|nr:hypothetical protein [Woeseiaceae bacterium]